MTTGAEDPYGLQRFVDAQRAVYDQVRAELAAGQKRSHWMWFIFPQIEGLGSSMMSRRYAISSRQEAAAYLMHPLLGARLRECTRLVAGIDGRSIHEIFGSPDDMKFQSSMTLFAQVASGDQDFREALQKYFAGEFDPATLVRLQSAETQN
jgi:uncharacterized protein (DUF1810 family)